MEIFLNIKSLVDDIGSKFMMETGSVDALPPRGTVIQSINESNARLTALCGRFLNFMYDEIADDELGIIDASIRYEFVLSPRKAVGKARPLADSLHSYIVNASLCKILSSMSLADLASKHEAQSVADSNVITQLLKSKIPPML